MDFNQLSKTILEAVKKSNVGILGVATVAVNETLKISNFQTESNRSDIDANNPLIVFVNSKNKKLTLAANAIASLRMVDPDAGDVNAVTVLADTKFATGITQRTEFCFLKELIEKLDGDFNAEKMRLECVHRLNVPSADNPEMPAMVASCYNGSTDYYDALGQAGGDQTAMQRAREELHASGIRDSFKGKTPATDPQLYAWVPIFKLTMAE